MPVVRRSSSRFCFCPAEATNPAPAPPSSPRRIAGSSPPVQVPPVSRSHYPPVSAGRLAIPGTPNPDPARGRYSRYRRRFPDPKAPSPGSRPVQIRRSSGLSRGRESRSGRADLYSLVSHLVAAEVLIVEALQPAAQFFGIDLVGNRRCLLRRLEDGLFHVDRAVQPKRQRQGIARTGIHADQLTVAIQPDHGVERVVLQFAHHHFAQARIEAKQKALDEVVSHGPRRRDLFDLESNRIGLVHAHPDRENRVTVEIPQDHYGHVCHGIHHEPANLHFDFHDALPNFHYTTVALSPTKELGPERVTRTGRYFPIRESPPVSGCVKFRVRLSVVLPIHCPRA